MDMKTCIELRSSSREYKSDPIPLEIVDDILNAARLAPSPKNRQPWRFVVLYNSEKNNIVKICRESLYNSSKDFVYIMHNEIPSESYTFNTIEQAPVLILVFNAFPSQQALKKFDLSFDFLNVQAIGAAIENMLLRATDLGVDSLWVGDILAQKELIQEVYPQAGELVAGVVLGFSNVTKHSSPNRLPISELIKYNGG